MMDKLFAVMEGPAGRGARIALGVLLIMLGFARIGGPGGLALAVVGLVPLAMGVWGPCLLRLAFPGAAQRRKAAARRL
jgi:hypothetical protein